MLSNPVPGIILPKGAPWTPPQFIVTRTAADHVKTGSGPALDIGNGKEGAPVFAAADGTCSFFVDSGNGALIIRVAHGILFNGKATATGYAHVQSPPIVRQGQVVKRGDKIATVGSTGAPGQPHLHFGVQLAGVSVDPWPLLQQNHPQEDDMTPGVKQAGDHIGTFQFDGVPHNLISPIDTDTQYPQPPNAGPFGVIAVVDLKDGKGKPIDINGNQPPRNGRDQVYLVDAPNFGVAAYALRADGVFTRTPGGFTQSDLDDAYNAGRSAVQAAAAGVPPK